MKHIKEYNDIINDFKPIKLGKGDNAFVNFLNAIKKNFPKIDKEAVKGEIKRYKYGAAGEKVDTVKYFKLLKQVTISKKFSKEEKKFFLKQSIDMFKLFGIVIPFTVLFPIPLPLIGTITLVFLEYVFRKLGIKILPDAFYRDYTELEKEMQIRFEEYMKKKLKAKELLNAIKSEFYDAGNIGFLK